MAGKTTHRQKVAMVAALAARGVTVGERAAAEAALQRLATTPRKRAPEPAREPLTDAIVKAEPVPETGSRIRYDTMAGFGLRTTSTGKKSWILNYRVKGSGLERRYTIGGFPSLAHRGGAQGSRAAAQADR